MRYEFLFPMWIIYGIEAPAVDRRDSDEARDGEEAVLSSLFSKVSYL